jgi:NADH-quinone oxidoreductase subunit N
VSIVNFEPSMLLAILPEIALLVLAGIIVAYDAVWRQEQRRWLGWITVGGLVVILLISLLVSRPGDEPQLLFGGMLRQDWFGFAFKLLFLFGAAITSLFAMDVKEVGQRGEFYALLLVSTLGMALMASAADMIMLYLAIETTSIPLYILAGFMTREKKSTEAGFKYFLFGAATSTIMLYGFSLLYGFSGTTNLATIAESFNTLNFPMLAVIGSFMLVFVGFGFKVSAVPLHFWAPDVYEGSPTPVLIRVLMMVYTPVALSEWTNILATISVITMTVGNLLALAQKNIKRMLAFSSIAHAGYILIGVVAASQLGMASILFYLAAYLITNLAAFGVVVIFWQVVGSDDIASYAGLSRRSPGLALAMMVAFLSLAGMPPLAGFVAKVFVFASAIQVDYVWLAVVGVLNSIVGLYYYLTVLKVVYLYRSDDEAKPLPISRPNLIALTVLTVGIVLVGTLFGPWFNLSAKIAAVIF